MGKIIRNGIEYSGTYDSATSVNYDNSVSGLNANSVQEGMDELADGLKNTSPVDNLLSTSTTLPLSANQGRVLDKKIADMKNYEVVQIWQDIPNYFTNITKVAQGYYQRYGDIVFVTLNVVLTNANTPITGQTNANFLPRPKVADELTGAMASNTFDGNGFISLDANGILRLRGQSQTAGSYMRGFLVYIAE